MVFGDYSPVVKVDYLKKLPSLILSNVFLIDRTNKFIGGINLGMTTDFFLKNLVDKTDVSVFKKDKSLSGTELLGTGMIVRKMKNPQIIDEFNIAVSGDLNGDCKISLSDFVQLKSHILRRSKLMGVNLTAADLNNSGSVSLTDFVQMKGPFAKKYKIDKIKNAV